jgi:hypothetical protein
MALDLSNLSKTPGSGPRSTLGKSATEPALRLAMGSAWRSLRGFGLQQLVEVRGGSFHHDGQRRPFGPARSRPLHGLLGWGEPSAAARAVPPLTEGALTLSPSSARVNAGRPPTCQGIAQ